MLLCYSRGNGNSLLSKCKIDKGWNKHAIAQFQNRDIILTPLFQDNYFASKVFNEERFSNKNPKHRKAVDPQCFQPVMAVVFFFFFLCFRNRKYMCFYKWIWIFVWGTSLLAQL